MLRATIGNRASSGLVVIGPVPTVPGDGGGGGEADVANPAADSSAPISPGAGPGAGPGASSSPTS